MLTYLRKKKAAGAAYAANAVHFDGTNDYVQRGAELSSATDTGVGLMNFWLKPDVVEDPNWAIIWVTAGGTSRLEKTNGVDQLRLDLQNAAASHVLTATFGSFGWVDPEPWHHVLVAWDLAASYFEAYIDDADAGPSVTALVDDDVDWTRSDLSIGAFVSPIKKYGGDMADFYINIDETLDITVAANRRKFIDASGKPVDLGSDGSAPTGSQPIILFSGATATWHVNKGYGGGFTEFGALTDAASSPSD